MKIMLTKKVPPNQGKYPDRLTCQKTTKAYYLNNKKDNTSLNNVYE